MGKTDAAAAEAAGVTRPTVTDWRHHHPVFLATLHEHPSALWSEAHGRLRALVGHAIENLETAVQEGKVSVSLAGLKLIGLYGAVGAPSGPTNPDAIIRAMAEAHTTREGLLPQQLDELLLKREGNPARARRMEALTAALRARYLEHRHER
jgi:hypothetical protein